MNQEQRDLVPYQLTNAAGLGNDRRVGGRRVALSTEFDGGLPQQQPVVKRPRRLHVFYQNFYISPIRVSQRMGVALAFLFTFRLPSAIQLPTSWRYSVEDRAAPPKATHATRLSVLCLPRRVVRLRSVAQDAELFS
jgi:hypothetical protein